MQKEKISDKNKLFLSSKWLIFGGIILLIIISSLIYKKNSLRNSILSNKMPIATSIPTTAQINIHIQGPQEGVYSQQEYIRLAIEDLDKSLAIDKNLIKVEKIMPVEWSDSSLGCPEKNTMYTPVIIPGYTVELSTLGKIYTYHAGSNRVISCKVN